MVVTPHLNLGNGGGSERQIIELTNGLVGKGHKVTVLLTDRKGDLISELSSEIDVVFHRSATNLFSRLVLIYKTAKVQKPDILYSRLWRTKPATVFAGKILGIKTVLVEVNNINAKLSLQLSVIRKVMRLVKVICYKMSDLVITQSEEGRKSLSDLGVEKKSRTVHNGINTYRIEEQSKEKVLHNWFNDDVPVAVAVGRLNPQKGYENLIEAISVVNETSPLRLLIIGGGPLKNKIAGKAEELGVKDKVDFTGSVSNPHKYMAKCDIFVCSSVFEGFSNSLLEALALGLPTVSTDHKFGANEMIENGKSGILVPVGDCDGMAGAVLKLLQNKTLAAKIGEEAKKRAKHFAIEKMVDKNLQIFKETLKR